MTANEKLELPISWGWFLALGISMVIFGTLGIAFAFYLTLASVIMFGVLAIVSGVLQFSHGIASKEDDWSGKALHLLVALMYVVFGGLVLWDPVSGSYSITLILAACWSFAHGLCVEVLESGMEMEIDASSGSN